MNIVDHFECTRCGKKFPGDRFQTLCPEDGGVLYARYDLGGFKKKFTRDKLKGRVDSMWRYAEVLPQIDPVTLGEGMTPMIASRRHKNVWIKDEGVNPTGSFKARGLCVTVSAGKHFGVKKMAIPSAGNAGSALSAYAAAAGIEAHVFMPKDVPVANLVDCKAYGAQVNLVDGLISDCGKLIAEKKEKEGWFEIATLKEPFRVEGKKTMGYEVAEQMEWTLPDAIFYPTGGGVGLVGMWKAFEEMEQLGWIGKERPKMIAVQSEGCAPIPKAFAEGKAASEMWKDAHTFAAGLRVPKAYGDYIVLDIVRKSGGTAIAVSEKLILESLLEWSHAEAFFPCPEGAACFAAYDRLIADRFLKKQDKVVIFNTGSGYKYVDMIAKEMKLRGGAAAGQELPKSRNIGGIIGPF